MPLSPAVRELAQGVRTFWGARGGQWRVDTSRGSVSFVVYDAFSVHVGPVDGAIRVQAQEIGGNAFAPTDETADSSTLPRVFARLDVAFRAALPAAFLDRFDAWVTEAAVLP